MPNNCENCTHWRKQPARPESVIPAPVGECRANPPQQSYIWPRTHATDYCSYHSAAARYAVALQPKPEYAEPKSAKPTKARRAGELPL